MNRAVIRLLEKAIGRSESNESKNLHHDLDRFSGAWSTEEATELEERLGQSRAVDEELWR